MWALTLPSKLDRSHMAAAGCSSLQVETSAPWCYCLKLGVFHSELCLYNISLLDSEEAERQRVHSSDVDTSKFTCPISAIAEKLEELLDEEEDQDCVPLDEEDQYNLLETSSLALPPLKKHRS